MPTPIDPRSARAGAYILCEGWNTTAGQDPYHLSKARQNLADRDDVPPPMSPSELRAAAWVLLDAAMEMEKNRV